MGKIKQKHVPAIDDDGENEQEMAEKKKKKKIGRKSPCPPSTDGADRRLSAPHRSAVKARRICQRQPQDQQEELWKKKNQQQQKKTKDGHLHRGHRPANLEPAQFPYPHQTLSIY